MRYQTIKDNNHYRVVDSSFSNATLCRTASEERANEIRDNYNQRLSDADAPVVLDVLANCSVESMPIRETFRYSHFGKVVAEKQRLKDMGMEY